MINKIISSNQKTFFFFLFIGFVCYFFILPTPFKTLDDYVSIVDNELLRNWSNIIPIFQKSFFGGDAYYRPLVEFSFLIEYQFFGLKYFFYNLNNIFLHILTSFSVFLLLKQIIAEGKIVFWSSFLFLIHPIHWEHVTNIPGRSILLCALFFILSCYLFLKSNCHREEQSDAAIPAYRTGRHNFRLLRFLPVGRHGARDDVWLYFLSLVCFFLSLLSKESGALVPICLFFAVIFLMPKQTWKFQLLKLIPYFILIAVYLWIRSSLGITKVSQNLPVETILLAMITFLKSLWIHAHSLVFPVELPYDRALKVFESFADPLLILTLLSWMAVAVILIVYRKKISLLSWFLVFWIAINFASVSQIVPIYSSPGRISIADHFLYLPSIGVFVFIVLGYQKALQYCREKEILRESLIHLITVSLLIFLVLMTVKQNLYSSNQIAMFEHALDANPDNTRVRNSLGTAYGYAGKPKKAEVHFRGVVEREPWNAKARIGLGKSLCDQGRCYEALQEYEQVQYPGDSLDLLMGNIEKTLKIVIEEFEEKIQNNPNDLALKEKLSKLYFKQGHIYDLLKEYDKALESFQKFIQNEDEDSEVKKFVQQRMLEIKALLNNQ